LAGSPPRTFSDYSQHSEDIARENVTDARSNNLEEIVFSDEQCLIQGVQMVTVSFGRNDSAKVENLDRDLDRQLKNSRWSA
jgi:hypothetical protein